MKVDSAELDGIILDVVADDYEDFEMVVSEVSKWAVKSARKVQLFEIERALLHAIEEELVQAFDYSESSAQYIAVKVDGQTLRNRWFYITVAGKAKLLEQDAKVSLTRDPINAESLVAEAKKGEDGAVVVFDGIVRDNTRGRKTVHLDYEAYEEMALKQMGELAAQAREKFGVRHVTIVHRLGRLLVGETSVLIVVASAHRGQAFEACRWVIDTLKKTVPVWKKETFVDGAVWADGEPFPEGVGVEAKDAS